MTPYVSFVNCNIEIVFYKYIMKNKVDTKFFKYMYIHGTITRGSNKPSGTFEWWNLSLITSLAVLNLCFVLGIIWRVGLIKVDHNSKYDSHIHRTCSSLLDGGGSKLPRPSRRRLPDRPASWPENGGRHHGQSPCPTWPHYILETWPSYGDSLSLVIIQMQMKEENHLTDTHYYWFLLSFILLIFVSKGTTSSLLTRRRCLPFLLPVCRESLLP